MEKTIEEKKATLPPGKLAELNRALSLSMEEYCLFQDKKSLAQANGKLNHEEAQTIYSLLGDGPAHFNDQSLAIKATLTKVFHELF